MGKNRGKFGHRIHQEAQVTINKVDSQEIVFKTLKYA